MSPAHLVGILTCLLAACASDGELPFRHLQEDGLLASWPSGKVTRDDLHQFRAYMALGRSGQDAGVESLALMKILAEGEVALAFRSTDAYRKRWLFTVADLVEKPLREYSLARMEVDADELSRQLAQAKLRPADVRYQVQHIFIRKPVDGSLEARSGSILVARESARDAFKRARAGESFGNLVAEFSESQSRFRNGRINTRLSDLPPELALAIGRLEEGDISPPLETTDGIHVFLCNNRKLIPAQTYSEKRDVLIKGQKRAAFNQMLSADTARMLSVVESEDTVSSQLVGELRIEATTDGIEKQRIAQAITVTDKYLEEKDAIDQSVGADIARHAGIHLLAQNALASRVADRMDRYSPTEQELRALYETSMEKGKRSLLYDVEVLMLRAPKLAHAVSVQERAEALRAALTNRELDFATAASQYSDFDRADDGTLRSVSTEQIAALGIRFSKVLLATPIGDVTDVVEEIPWGSKAREYWIGRVVNVREKPRMSFGEAHNSLMKQALRLQREETQNSVQSELLAEVDWHFRR